MRLRSGLDLSDWDGPVITVDDPVFSLEDLVARHLSEDPDDSEDDLDLVDGLDDGDGEEDVPQLAGQRAASSSNPPPRVSHDRHRQKEARKKRRAAQQPPQTITPRPSARRNHVDNAQPIHTTTKLASLRVTSTGYTATRDETSSTTRTRTYTLAELVGPQSKLHMQLFKWDGRTAVPIVDQQNRVIAVLAGSPSDNSWPSAHEQLAETIDTLRPILVFNSKQRHHRRGRFPATAHGFSFGGGQTEPRNVAQDAANVVALTMLLTHFALVRVAGFAAGVMALWAPRLYAYYAKYLDALTTHHGVLPNFARTVWAALTINYGPRTVSYRHRDYANLTWGWCPITALGWFDHTKGGHLILWDLGLVIEFPAGATVLIPSGILEHSNTAIAAHEKRFSVTQYSAGSLFRWVDQGFRTKEEYLASMDRAAYADAQEKAATRYKEGLKMFSTLDELRSAATVDTSRAENMDTDTSTLTPLSELDMYFS
ncbi:hypothetical protein EV715DRAFT_214420 [Schizophyllum commune]